jgi:hypothetical protein
MTNDAPRFIKRTSYGLRADKLSLMGWVSSNPGSSSVYHRGYLPTDRSPEHVKHHDQKMMAPAVGQLANLMSEMADEGLVYLTQNRINPMDYEYIATVTSCYDFSERVK